MHCVSVNECNQSLCSACKAPACMSHPSWSNTCLSRRSVGPSAFATAVLRRSHTQNREILADTRRKIVVADGAFHYSPQHHCLLLSTSSFPHSRLERCARDDLLADSQHVSAPAPPPLFQDGFVTSRRTKPRWLPNSSTTSVCTSVFPTW